MQSFRNLRVWRKAHELTLGVYRETRGFPQREVYGLTRQLRRSAASIPENIAEGCVRKTDAEFRQFLHIAMGSASELEYQLLLARDLELLKNPVHAGLEKEVLETKKMLASLIRKLTAES